MGLVKAGFNKVFKELNQSKHRYRVVKGSAGSGKSVNVAMDYIIKLTDNKFAGCNLLVIRGTETSHQYSTFAELTRAIDVLGLSNYWDIKTFPLSLTCKLNGNSIIFRGFNDARARERVKSINFPSGKLCWIWVEEATELRFEDLMILDDRLRGELNEGLYYQITMTFNPVSSTHWIKSKFWDNPDPTIYKSHSTYLDNRFIDEGYKQRMLMRKEIDPEGYLVYGLGEWGSTEGTIFTHYKVQEISTNQSDYDVVYYGQDFGYNHHNAILEVAFKDNDIYVLSEIYVNNKDTSEIINIAEERGLNKKLLMYCDSAEPDRIKMWKKAGYKALPVSKEKDSISNQIDFIKQRKLFIHPSCVNLIKEISQWKWQKDNRTGEYTDVPVNVFDDAIAALRYGIEGQRKANKKLRSLNKNMF